MTKSNKIKFDYAVVVPIYNSADSLRELHQKLSQAFSDISTSYQLVFVEDQSPDSSWKVLSGIYNQDKKVKIIRLAKNVGMWHALHCGISNTNAKHIINIDDDLEYNPADIKLLVEEYHNNKHAIVYGIPEGKSKKNFENKLSFKLRSKLVDFLLGKEKTESFRIFNRNVFFDENGMAISHLHFEAHAKHHISQNMVGYVNVSYHQRKYGNSGHNFLKKIKILVRFTPEFRAYPLRWGIYLGLIMFISAITLFIISNKIDMWDTIRDVYFLFIISGIALIITILALLGNYTYYSFLHSKGVKDYLILEKKEHK